ncbi:MAG: type I DNA topoisomerase [Nitrospirae bacterium]|nr:type I DNA topoisomerase [Nitrospirota bacterium]
MALKKTKEDTITTGAVPVTPVKRNKPVKKNKPDNPATPDETNNVPGGLVIVESPAKAKTIEKILGKGFSVKASVGHILDLPKKELGVDTANGFTPKYITIPGKEKVISDLRAAAKKASNIYLAPDPDREGEAIAWHIAETITAEAALSNVYRVTFNEITERAVREAMKSPTLIDTNKVNAQQARRVLDRLVGYTLSPLLWKKVSYGLSAGRVQSVAVRIVVEREREIEAFNQEEYWSITAKFAGAVEPEFPARLFKYKGDTVIERALKNSGDAARKENKFLITSGKDAELIKESLLQRNYSLVNIDRKEKRRTPYPPFITSTLQQEASRKLRFTAKKTMSTAQRLYEGVAIGKKGAVGLITYMRTDSTRIAPEAVQWSREYIEKTFGKEYLPQTPHHYKVKAQAQEAHEAIRPTYMEYPPEVVEQYLPHDQYALYELIWKRFIASQMAAALMELTTFDIFDDTDAKDAHFRATGTVIKFRGFLALYSETPDTEESDASTLLPDLKENDALKLLDIRPQQHFTQPPPRFTEATLVKTLEDKGIGRPSTYAATLSTIEDRKYVVKEDGKFKPSGLGTLVNDFLVKRFHDLIDITFTAKMEDDLDRIETGEIPWKDVIGDFYLPFNKDIEKASKSEEKVFIPTNEVCEKCGKPMVMKAGRFGTFLACSGYPECKTTRPIDPVTGQIQQEVPVELSGEICDKCSNPMVIKTGRFGKFLGCSNYPTCKNMKPISMGLKCPLDGGDIIERRATKSKFKGKLFYSCGNYPDCKYISSYKPVGEVCPNCGATLLYEKIAKSGDKTIFCQNNECKYSRTQS